MFCAQFVDLREYNFTIKLLHSGYWPGIVRWALLLAGSHRFYSICSLFLVSPTRTR